MKALFHEDPFAVRGEPCTAGKLCPVEQHHAVDVVGKAGRTIFECPQGPARGVRLAIGTLGRDPTRAAPPAGSAHRSVTFVFGPLTLLQQARPRCSCGGQLLEADGDPWPFVDPALQP